MYYFTMLPRMVPESRCRFFFDHQFLQWIAWWSSYWSARLSSYLAGLLYSVYSVQIQIFPMLLDGQIVIKHVFLHLQSSSWCIMCWVTVPGSKILTINHNWWTGWANWFCLVWRSLFVHARVPSKGVSFYVARVFLCSISFKHDQAVLRLQRSIMYLIGALRHWDVICFVPWHVRIEAD